MAATLHHPGLTFATLIVQFVMAQGAFIARVTGRSSNKKGGDDEGDTVAAAEPKPTTPSTTPQANHESSSSTKSSSSTSSSASTSTPVSISSPSTSSSPTPPATPVLSPGISGSRSRNLNTPGIIGIVIGSVVLVGLILMTVAICIRRAKKSRKLPQGSPLSNFFPGDSKPPPVTEMSQTQSNPLVSSAVTTGATSTPLLSRFSPSFSPSVTTASLSPLILASSLHHSHSVGSSSDRSTAYTHPTVDLEILQRPYDSPLGGSSGGLLPIISAAAGLGSAHLTESSGLHRSMANHQKALEADDKGQDVGNMQFERFEGVNDPPPEYDA